MVDFLSPIYQVIFFTFPSALSYLAGMILLLTLARIVSNVPKYGKMLEYSIYALMVTNSLLGLASSAVGGFDASNILEDIIMNATVLIIFALGLVLFLKLKRHKYLKYIFSYYMLWVVFYIFCLLFTIPIFHESIPYTIIEMWIVAGMYGLLVIPISFYFDLVYNKHKEKETSTKNVN